MPVGPSGVVFVRKSHRFIRISSPTATQRSDLVLFQAETTPGEPRFRLATRRRATSGRWRSPQNGEWLLSAWLSTWNQWLFLRLTSAKVESVSNIVEQPGAVGERTAREVIPLSLSWPVPHLLSGLRSGPDARSRERTLAHAIVRVMLAGWPTTSSTS